MVSLSPVVVPYFPYGKFSATFLARLASALDHPVMLSSDKSGRGLLAADGNHCS